MTNANETHGADRKATTRYIWVTRYEGEPSGLERNDDASSIKNFPRAFLPMRELEDSPMEP